MQAGFSSKFEEPLVRKWLSSAISSNSIKYAHIGLNRWRSSWPTSSAPHRNQYHLLQVRRNPAVCVCVLRHLDDRSAAGKRMDKLSFWPIDRSIDLLAKLCSFFSSAQLSAHSSSNNPLFVFQTKSKLTDANR